MSGRGYYPYTSCDIDPQEHARWILAQMGADASDILDDRYHRDDSNNSDDSDDSDDSNNSDDSYDSDDSNNSDDSDDIGVKYLFRRLHKKWSRMKLKYIRQKSGGGCGSGKRFVPVSCSKNCSKCHGCSPGCGRNYEFEKIDGFSLDPQIWNSLRKQSDENPEINYIIRRYCGLY